MGIMSTEAELALEQSQQGISYEVSVSIKGVEELKRNVRIKGVKKEALHTTLGKTQNIRVILFSIHSDNGNPSRVNIKQLCDGSAEVQLFDNYYNNDIFNMFTQEEQYTELLESIPKPHQVQQNDSNVIYEVPNVEQGGGTIEQHFATVEKTRTYFESLYNNLAIEVEKVNMFLKEASKFVHDFKSLANEADESLAKHKALEFEIEHLLRVVDTTKGMSANTQFRKQSILGKRPSSSGSKLYSVTPFPKSKGLPKIDESHALSKPVTSNSVPTPQESKVMKNDHLIAPGMFRINIFKTSREEKSVPNKPIKARTTLLRPAGHSLGSIQRMIGSSMRLRIVADVYVLNYVNDMNSRVKKINANVSNTANKKKHKPKVLKPKKVGFKEILASPTPRKPRTCLRWSLTGRIFDLKGKIIKSSESESQSDCSDSKNAYLVVDFKRKTCLVRNLKGVDLLKGNRTTNLYTINLHEMASASLICLMARATSTKSWLWHQRLSHVNFDTINDLAKNDLVIGLTKFKYHKEHLCPSCEQEKAKKESHPPKPILNSKQRLHLLHMDLCGSMRVKSINGKRYVLVIVDDYSRDKWVHFLISKDEASEEIDFCGPMSVESINGKRYVLVIVDDYSRYTWVHFLGSKDEAPEEIKTFLKKITVLLQAPVIFMPSEFEKLEVLEQPEQFL
nr:retrovirus-related Pol polyprotein from transposon TNT 1-94 [Tanacetum cinerariifolium]